MANVFEYVGYGVLAYSLFWALWAFISPDSFEPLRGTARQMQETGSIFFQNPTMAMYPLGYIVVLYVFGFLLVGWITVYMGRMLRRHESPGSLVGMMLIVSVVLLWKFIAVFMETPFLAALGVIVFGIESIALFMYYFVKP